MKKLTNCEFSAAQQCHMHLHGSIFHAVWWTCWCLLATVRKCNFIRKKRNKIWDFCSKVTHTVQFYSFQKVKFGIGSVWNKFFADFFCVTIVAIRRKEVNDNNLCFFLEGSGTLITLSRTSPVSKSVSVYVCNSSEHCPYLWTSRGVSVSLCNHSWHICMYDLFLFRIVKNWSSHYAL